MVPRMPTDLPQQLQRALPALLAIETGIVNDSFALHGHIATGTTTASGVAFACYTTYQHAITLRLTVHAVCKICTTSQPHATINQKLV